MDGLYFEGSMVTSWLKTQEFLKAVITKPKASYWDPY